MQEVLVLRGLPRSGKSTFADGWLKQDINNRVVLTKDDIALEHAGVRKKCQLPTNKTFRKEVNQIQLREMQYALHNGQSVCLADTNFGKDRLDKIIAAVHESGVQANVSVDGSFMSVPLIEVLNRNEKSGCDMVPENVIMSMWDTFVKGTLYIKQDHTLPKAVVFDMDGTLAFNTNRGIYDTSPGAVLTDAPNEPIMELAKMYQAEGFRIIISSARPQSCLLDTRQWLAEHYIWVDVENMYFRNPLDVDNNGHHIKDWLVKDKIAKDIVTHYHIVNWIDDRWQVVVHLRELGINVLQSNFGRF